MTRRIPRPIINTRTKPQPPDSGNRRQELNFGDENENRRILPPTEQQRLGGFGDAAITIPATPSFANRNYKQQNLMVSPQPAKKPEVATRLETDESVGN
jgi:hypothetical protein